jgi:hypothetical protein
MTVLCTLALARMELELERARERERATSTFTLRLMSLVACKNTVVGGRGFTGP